MVGAGRERGKMQRTAMRYEVDGHGKYVGQILLLLAVVIMTARTPPPHKRADVEWQ